LDLSNCSLRTPPPGLAQAAAVAILDLTENPLTTLPDSSLLGFTNLQLLAVPLALECPGGSSAWETVTLSGSSRLCQGQRNTCNGSAELGTAGTRGGCGAGTGLAPVTPPLSALPAWPCPENSACAPDGPGLVQCLCEGPFHGYKCLRE
ncbi:ARAID factor, partial [Trogon melanurus]|nr:ARAID factor [Trogon melanurus]